MTWCDTDSSLSSFSSCFCETWLNAPSNFLFFVFFCIRIYSISVHIEPFDQDTLKNLPIRYNLLFSFTVVTGLLYSSFFIAFPGSIAPSLLCYIISETVVWLLCSIIISKEAHRFENWPGTEVKSFFFISMALNTVTLSVQYDAKLTSGAFFCSFGIVFLNTLCLLLAMVDSAPTSSKDEIPTFYPLTHISVSDDEYSGGEKRSRQEKYKKNGNFFSRFFSLFSTSGLKDPFEPLFLKREPIVLSALERHLGENPDRGLYDMLIDDDSANSSKNGSRGGETSQYILNTVMEYLSIVPGLRFLSPTKTEQKKRANSAFESNYSFSTLDNGTDSLISEQNEDSFNSSLEYSFGSETDSSHSSSALRNAMEHHYNKVNAKSPMLVPSNAVGNTFSNPTQVTADHTAECFVTIQKWSWRRDGNSRSTVESDSSDGGMIDLKKETEEENGKDVHDDVNTSNTSFEGENTSINDSKEVIDNEIEFSSTQRANDSSSPTYVGDEVEFEIVVHLNKSLVSPGYSAWNTSTGDSPNRPGKTDGFGKTHSWTVWRSCSELQILHINIVSLLGDLAPRRPRLKCLVKKLNGLSTSDMLADFRAISIFLNVLLRNHNYQKVAPLLAFLNYPKSLTKTDPNNPNENNLKNFSKTFDKEGPILFPNLKLGKENLTLMDIAEEKQANLTANSSQEKWRKLYFHMKLKLRPTDVGVRCRLFEGVMSGADITAFLMRSGDDKKDTYEYQYQYAQDRYEACAIGQELMDCGLLVSICSGFKEEITNGNSDDDDDAYDVHSERVDEMKEVGNGKIKNVFSDIPGYIYRFSAKTNTMKLDKHANAVLIFGAAFSIKIPLYTIADDEVEDALSSRDTTRDTLTFPVDDDRDSNIFAGNYGPTAKVHIKYLIETSHGGDTWQVWRRYREFEQLHKNILKDGVRSDAVLPKKQMGRGSNAQLDKRRIGLQSYLEAISISVINSEEANAKVLLAQFLDDDYDNLCIDVQ